MPSEFLPPDPYADASGESTRPGFSPPAAPPTSGGNRAVLALAAGASALGLLVLSTGALFFVTLPAAVAGWVLGRRAKAAGQAADQANVAVIMGIVGTIASVIGAGIWIAVWT